MNRPRLSIRVRLTLWYTVVLMVILAVTYAAVYLFVHNQFETMVRAKLDDGYGVVEAVIVNSGGDIYDVVHLGHDTPFRLFKDGNSEYVTRAWIEAELPSTLDSSEFDPYGLFNTSDGHRYIIRLDRIGKYEYQLAYAQDATEIQANLSTLTTILVASLPCALILGLLGGYFMAGRALNPIRAITSRAREISAENLSQRLPVVNDGDEIGALSEVFNATLSRLESSFEQLKRFTADASHELRTPAAAIRTIGEVTVRGPQDLEVYKEALANILAETNRLTHLLDSLLMLARGDTEALDLKPEAVNLVALVTEITDEIGVLVDQKGQSLSVDAPHPITGMIDRSTMRLALLNVVHNAINYSPTGGQISVKVASENHKNAVITVSDNGPGIPAAERERVFERFYRIDKARSRATGGVGLGLSIARWAVGINGGTIAFVESDGDGARCRITLPQVFKTD